MCKILEHLCPTDMPYWAKDYASIFVKAAH